MDRSEMLRDSNLFAAVALAAGDETEVEYLGSAEVVDTILRNRLVDWFDALAGGTASLAMAKEIAIDLAKIFIGRVPGYVAVAGWNEPGKIDQFVATQSGITDKDAMDRMEHFFAMLLREALAIVKYADKPGVLEEHWRFQVDGMFETAVYTLLGIDEDTIELLSSAGSSAPAVELVEGWVTINTDDDGEGGQRVYIDGAGRMQTGKFAGKTFSQAFGGKSGGEKDDGRSSGDGSGDAKPDDAAGPPSNVKHIDVADDAALGKQLKSFIKTGWRVSNDGQGKYFLHDPNTNEIKGSIGVKAADKPAGKPKKPGAGPAYYQPKTPSEPDQPPEPPSAAYVPPSEISDRVAAHKAAGGSVEWDGDVAVLRKGNEVLGRITPVNPNQPKLEKPAAFTNMYGDSPEAKSLFNKTLNETPHYIDGDSIEMAFDGIPAGQHDDLEKAIATVRPDLAKKAGEVNATKKQDAAAAQAKAAIRQQHQSVHSSLAGYSQPKPADMKKAFKDLPADKHDAYVDAVRALHGDEAADAATKARPKKKPAKTKATPSKPKAAKAQALKYDTPGVAVDGLNKQAVDSYAKDYSSALEDGEDEILNVDIKTKPSQVPSDPKTGFKIPVKGDAHYDDYQKMIKYQLAVAGGVGGYSSSLDPEDYELAVVPITSLQRSQTMDDFINDSSKGQSKNIGKWLGTGRAEDYAPAIVDASGVVLDGNHRLASRTLAKISHMAVLRPKSVKVPAADGSLVRTSGDSVKYQVGNKGVSLGNAISSRSVDRAVADGPEGIKSLMSIAHKDDRDKLAAKFAARGVDVTKLKESIALVPSIEQLASKLSDLSDGLISAAYDLEKGLLIGNFGDWADGETMDAFDAVAREFNLEPVHENEAGDLLELYPGAVEIPLKDLPTITQESLKRWNGYP